MSSSPVIISFIGWHNSGKTTLAAKVVTELQRRGRRLAVVKSTKESGLTGDDCGTDTALYQQAGGDVPVLLAAPDGLVLRQAVTEKPTLQQLARRWFAEVELVIGEGFKEEEGLVKIEVCRGGERLAGQVSGIVAVAGGAELASVIGERCFGLEEVAAIADFIEKHLLSR